MGISWHRNSTVIGLFGHLFQHGNWLHLVGNMLFLLVFGNAVCAKLGWKKYLTLYFLAGLGAALAHLAIDGDPCVGASGAICGVMAAYAVLFPWNKVLCIWGYGFHFVRRFGEIEVRGFWLVGLWVFLDLWWAAFSEGIIAHWAHLGGYALGFGYIALLISTQKIEFKFKDRPLLGQDQVPEEREVIVTKGGREMPVHAARPLATTKALKKVRSP
jgi:membrane associated rhomboid family serine protease